MQLVAMWYLVCFVVIARSELNLGEQLINPEEPDPIYDLFAVTVSVTKQYS